ncbi:hypothetical protein Tco_0155369 [Tanacetum coccineum]
MDDPNITIEEYIRLEEEKARKCWKVFNWETAKYGKIWYDEDIHDLRSVETEFLAIAFNDGVSSEKTLSCEPTTSSLNNEIVFRISFNDSDDEDYTWIRKMDSENDNEKVNLPLLPSPEPAISCFDILDFFKDFVNEFPAIFYNDAQISKSDLLTESILSPQHIDAFDLNDETSLSEYDEEEQNVLYFNDLFPFNIIHPDNLKSEKDNDDNEIDIIQSSGGKLVSKDGYGILDMAPVPPHEQRHPFLRYQGLEYTDVDIANFEERMVMEHRDDVGVVVFTSRAWGRLFDTRGPLLGRARRRLSWRKFILALGLHIGEEMESPGFARDISTDGDFLGPPPSYTLIRDPVLRLCHRMIAHNIAGRSQAPKMVTVTDLFYLRGLDVGSVNIPYLLARYLRRFAAGRKSGDHISCGQFVARLPEHFGLLTAEILKGLMVIAPKLPVIDMAELVRLQICMQIDETWAWVAMGPERQPDATASAPRVAQDAPAVDEGDQANLAPMQAPQQPPPPTPTTARTMPQRLGRLEEEVQGLRRDVGSLCGLVERSMTDQGRFYTWMISCMA